MLGDILIAVIMVFLIWLTLKAKKKGGAMLFDKNKELYSAEVMDSPLDLTERSLISKRDQALERAARRAHLTWKDRRALRRNISQGLLDLTRQTGEDVREALVTKLRSDLNLFVSAHELRNLASLERLRLSFEEMLVEACSASARRRAQAKASALIEMVEAVSKKHEELKKLCNGRDDYKNRAEESFDRIFENTMREIETLNVSLRNKRLFTE
jgi:hypothetical protein